MCAGPPPSGGGPFSVIAFLIVLIFLRKNPQAREFLRREPARSEGNRRNSRGSKRTHCAAMQQKHRLLVLVATALIGTGCTGVFGATEDLTSEPFKAAGLPGMRGQMATCNGPREKTFTLEALETSVDLGLGIKFAGWRLTTARCPDRSSKRAKATPSSSR
jgi:hypothetical protein